MSNVIVEEQSLQNIGNAIRNVTNTTNNFYPNQMGPAIENISMGPKIRDASYLFYKDARLDNYKSFINLLDNNMYKTDYMFYGCSLDENEFASLNFNTTNVSDTSYMFYQCYKLIDIPKCDFSNVHVAAGMFGDCVRLKNISSIQFSSWLANADNMFYNCTNLVDVPEYDFSKVNSMRQMFAKCNNLSDASIQNIINSCLNVPSTFKSFEKRLSPYDSASIFYQSNITNDRYQNRWQELTDAGWSY